MSDVIVRQKVEGIGFEKELEEEKITKESYL